MQLSTHTGVCEAICLEKRIGGYNGEGQTKGVIPTGRREMQKNNARLQWP